MKNLGLITGFLLFTLFCNAQNNDDRRISYDRNGIIEGIEFVGNDMKIPESSNAFFKEYLKIKENDSFILTDKNKDKLGVWQEHYDQYYSKIKVFGAGYNFHYKDGKLFYAHGHFVKINSLNVTPSITTDKAVELYSKHLQISSSSIKNSTTELIIKEIFSDRDSSIKPFLTFKVKIKSDSIFISEYGFIDAHNGELLSTSSFIAGLSSTGTFETRYNGTKYGTTENYSGDYHLVDNSRGATIHTWNLQNSTDYLNDKVELSDYDNNWTSAEHRSNNNDMGLDVHWGIQQIYDYLYNTYGYNSYDEYGHAINSTVRHGVDYASRNKAFFDMDEDLLVFGDGYLDYGPWASLDVVAHEFGHGITDFQIGWAYSNNPWPYKAFHEGLSDIWAIIMDYRLTSHPAWLIGDQVDLDYNCLRNIQDPNGPSNGARSDIADTYMSDDYNYGNDHAKGGIFSYMFYLLVNGGSGTNDLNNNYKVVGVGMNLAEQLMVNTVYGGYLNNKVSWQGIRDAMVQVAHVMSSCDENYSSTLANQVENAWYAVGVGTQPTALFVTGNSLLCFSNTLYTVTLLPNSTVTWTSSNNITRISAQNANPCYFVTNTSGSGWVNARVTSQCDYLDIRYPVWAGTPVVNVTGPYEGCPNTQYTFQAHTASPENTDPFSYSWTINPYDGYISTYNGGNYAAYAYITFYNVYSASGYDVMARAQNSCGTGAYGETNIWIHDCYYFMLSPNPASESVTISRKTSVYSDAKASSLSTEELSKVFSVKVLDIYGNLHYSTTRSGEQFTIPTQNFKEGNYFVQISDGGKVISNLQLIIKR